MWPSGSFSTFCAIAAGIEADASRQRLQAHERDQLAQAGFDLEELAVLGLELELPAQAWIVDEAWITVPVERALQLGLAALHHVGIAHAAEKLARVGGGELEVEAAARRCAASPQAARLERRVGIGHHELLDAPVLPGAAAEDL